MKSTFITLICCWVTLLLFSISCNNDKSSENDNRIWDENENGTILTTDLDKLQKMTAFSIILPEYLPDDLADTFPTFTCNAETPISKIIIMFGTPDSVGLVYITESKASTGINYGIEDIDDPEYEQLLTIMEVTINERSVNSSHTYRWLHKGLLVYVNIVDYDQLKARQIVESMIK